MSLCGRFHQKKNGPEAACKLTTGHGRNRALKEMMMYRIDNHGEVRKARFRKIWRESILFSF